LKRGRKKEVVLVESGLGELSSVEVREPNIYGFGYQKETYMLPLVPLKRQ
jgi:hypothetical protein